MPETTFTGPDLTSFLGLDALGLTAVGQHLTAERAVIECRMPIGFEDPYARPGGPTQLVVRLRRFGCTRCREPVQWFV